MHTSTKRLSCNHGTLWVHPPNTLGASTERAGCTHRTPWVHPPNALGAPTERSGCIHRTPWVHPPNALGATTGTTMGAPTNPAGAPRITMGAPTNPGSAHSHWERPGLRWVHPPGCCPMFVHPKPRAAKKLKYGRAVLISLGDLSPSFIGVQCVTHGAGVAYLPLNHLSRSIRAPKLPHHHFAHTLLPSGANLLERRSTTNFERFPTHPPLTQSSIPFPSTTMARSKRSKPLPIPNFKKEGKGAVYINGRRRRRRWMRYRSGRQNHLAALRALELKVGHTSWLPRRVTQYRGCQSGAQKIVWYGYFSAQRRMHVERRVHMALERRGIHPVRGECAGDDCNTDHKEYFPMLLIRCFSRLLRIVRDEMVLAQEVDLKL
ncbi:hypothetical protein C8R43DRAFT_962772 [Mycena crocata]|nr:hypothetical protein C8R43DRAFT_962772 [Mycena crocata]